MHRLDLLLLEHVAHEKGDYEEGNEDKKSKGGELLLLSGLGRCEAVSAPVAFLFFLCFYIPSSGSASSVARSTINVSIPYRSFQDRISVLRSSEATPANAAAMLARG